MDSSDINEKPLLRRSDNLIADGRYEEAIESLDKFLEQYPDNQEAMSLKGLTYCLTGAVQKGVDILEQALEMDPSSKTVLITFADACLRSSMPEKSLHIIERAISYYPDDDGFVMLKKVILDARNRSQINSFFN